MGIPLPVTDNGDMDYKGKTLDKNGVNVLAMQCIASSIMLSHT